MPQVINKTSLGGNIGAGLGSGLSQGLQALVQNLITNKQQQQQMQQRQSGLQTLFPHLNPQQAQSLGGLDASTLNQLLKQQHQEQAGQQEFNTLQNLLNFGQGGNTAQPPVNQQGQQLPSLPEGFIRQGNALNIAKYLQDQQRHNENVARQNKQFDITKVQPRIRELQSEYNVLNDQLRAYQRLSELNKTGRAKAGIIGFMLPEESQEYNALLESLVPTGSKAQIESARKKLPNLNQSPNVQDKLINYNIKKINDELEQIRSQAQSLGVGDIFNIQQANEAPVENISQTQQLPIQQLQVPQQEQPTESQLPYTPGYLGSRIIKGGLSGVTSLATAPFNLANFLSLGNIPVPEFVQNIQNLPDQTLEAIGANIQPGSEGERWFGDFVEDLTSFLTPGGLLGTAGKVANLPKLQTAAKILGSSPKSAATVSAAGNFAKWATSKLGGTEAESNVAKAGAQLLVPILGSRLAGYKVQSLGNDIKNSIKPTDTIKSPSLVGKNLNFYEILTGEAESSLKDQALKAIGPLFNQKERATMSLSDVWNAKQILSQPNMSNLNGVKNYLPHLDKALESFYKSNPQFAQAVSEFTDLSNALKTTNIAYDFAKKYLSKEDIRNPLTYALTGLVASGTGLPKIKLGAALAGATLPLGEANRVLQMAIKSPAFRKYYGNYISSAISGNVKLAQTAARNLDKIITHEEKKLD